MKSSNKILKVCGKVKDQERSGYSEENKKRAYSTRYQNLL
jgi:hypothetical protein